MDGHGVITIWGRTPCSTSEYIVSEAGLKALCYPRPTRSCLNRLAALESIGISEVCTDLKAYPGGARLLGRGHTGAVALARGPSGLVAVKSARLDASIDLLKECKLARLAARAGAAPSVHYCSPDLIVMDAVLGPPLETALREGLASLPRLAEAALAAARALDAAGILHYEIHRPWRNILYTQSLRAAVIVDYDSAGPGCGNVSRLAQALAWKLTHRIDEELLAALRMYKKTCTLDAYYTVKVKLLETLSGG